MSGPDATGGRSRNPLPPRERVAVPGRGPGGSGRGVCGRLGPALGPGARTGPGETASSTNQCVRRAGASGSGAKCDARNGPGRPAGVACGGFRGPWSGSVGGFLQNFTDIASCNFQVWEFHDNSAHSAARRGICGHRSRGRRHMVLQLWHEPDNVSDVPSTSFRIWILDSRWNGRAFRTSLTRTC